MPPMVPLMQRRIVTASKAASLNDPCIPNSHECSVIRIRRFIFTLSFLPISITIWLLRIQVSLDVTPCIWVGVSLETLGTSHPTTQRHMLEELNL